MDIFQMSHSIISEKKQGCCLGWWAEKEEEGYKGKREEDKGQGQLLLCLLAYVKGSWSLRTELIVFLRSSTGVFVVCLYFWQLSLKGLLLMASVNYQSLSLTTMVYPGKREWWAFLLGFSLCPTCKHETNNTRQCSQSPNKSLRKDCFSLLQSKHIPIN